MLIDEVIRFAEIDQGPHLWMPQDREEEDFGLAQTDAQPPLVSEIEDTEEGSLRTWFRRPKILV